MCQPNNCVRVLQRLREGWQMCKMQILKPLKRNSNRTLLSSGISGEWDRRKPLKKQSPSQNSSRAILITAIICSLFLQWWTKDEPLVLPPLPRQGLCLLREQALGCACIREQASGKEQAKDRREHLTPAPGGRCCCRCAGRGRQNHLLQFVGKHSWI